MKQLSFHHNETYTNLYLHQLFEFCYPIPSNYLSWLFLNWQLPSVTTLLVLC